MSQYYPLVIPGGRSVAGSSIGFHAYSLRIDNLSNQWLLEETSLSWIPPYSLGMCLRLYGTGVAIILNRAPVGQPQLAAIAGEETIAVYSDLLRTEVAGVPVRQFTFVSAVSDLTEGPQPALPPVGVDRLYADPQGNIHHLHSDGTDLTLVDPSNAGTLLFPSFDPHYQAMINATPLGGDVQQTIGNTLVDRASGGFTVARNNANNGSALMPGLNFAAGGGEGISSPRSGSTNVFGLNFYTNSAVRFSIANAGNSTFFSDLEIGGHVKCDSDLMTASDVTVGGVNVVSGVTRYLFFTDINHYISDGAGVNHMLFATYGGWFSWYASNSSIELFRLNGGNVIIPTGELQFVNNPAIRGLGTNHTIGDDGNGWLITPDGRTAGGFAVDGNASNNGTLGNSFATANGLYFGGVPGAGSGEGISSKRSGGGNQFGLDFSFGWTVGVSMNGGGISIYGANLYFGGFQTSHRIQWNGTYFNFSDSIQYNATGNQVVWPNGSYISGNAGYVQGSSPTLKRNYIDAADADLLAIVADPRPKVTTYLWEGETRRNTGFLADELAAVAPEVVALDERGAPAGYYANELTAILWGAVRALNAKVEALTP